MASPSLKKQYPLHWLVWSNDAEELETALANGHYDLEERDPRGRTPLMLAVTLGHLESTRVLLRHNACVGVENRDGWNVVQEAVATGDPELVQEVMTRRDYQRFVGRVGGIPDLLQRLQDAPDFYVEMKWEFTSWMPLISRMCPSDTYKVYKSGPNVRIDTTFLGFDQSNWQRGNKSYIFKGQTLTLSAPKCCNRSYIFKLLHKGSGETATMMEIDHESRQVYSEQMRVITSPMSDVSFMRPLEEVVSARLTTPIVITYVDTDKISFERNKSGIWGWRSDKSEIVNGYECKVYNASNVELITKTRYEHLTEADKAKNKSPKSPFHSFLGIAEVEEKNILPVNGEVSKSSSNPCNITPEEYFNSAVDLCGRDIGRPKEILTKLQKFKATLCLCDQYPLSLQEQIMPIVDLMAISSSHFAKLKDFITLQLPAGFPVKIEIPLFHVLNARITFGNIFGLDEAIVGVSTINEDTRLACVLDDSCFESPPGYLRLGPEMRHQFSLDEDDELLQFAIQQSLLEAGTETDKVTVWEALKNLQPSPSPLPGFDLDEDPNLQRAIQESLSLSQANTASVDFNGEISRGDELAHPVAEVRQATVLDDEQLQLALALSKQERQEEERRRQQEEELLERVLKLSLVDK